MQVPCSVGFPIYPEKLLVLKAVSLLSIHGLQGHTMGIGHTCAHKPACTCSHTYSSHVTAAIVNIIADEVYIDGIINTDGRGHGSDQGEGPGLTSPLCFLALLHIHASMSACIWIHLAYHRP